MVSLGLFLNICLDHFRKSLESCVQSDHIVGVGKRGIGPHYSAFDDEELGVLCDLYGSSVFGSYTANVNLFGWLISELSFTVASLIFGQNINR